MLTAKCYPVNWEFRKWNFYGPKKTTTGQRPHKRRDLVPRLETRPATVVAMTEAATEARQAVAAVVPPTEVASVPTGSGEEMEIPIW